MFGRNINLYKLWFALNAKEASLSKVTYGSGLVFFLGALLCFGGTALMFSQGEGRAIDIIVYSLVSLKWIWILTVLSMSSFFLLRKKNILGVVLAKILWAYISLGLAVAAVISCLQIYGAVVTSSHSMTFFVFTRALAFVAFGFFSFFAAKGFRYVSRIPDAQFKM